MRRTIPGPCPLCKKEIEYLYQTETVPYFSDVLIISANCGCGYRLVDTIILNEGEPARWELAVDEPRDLEAKVVRSTKGTVEIPELGVLIEPGPICEAFISNVEGILVRIDSVVDRVLSWAEGEERENALALREKINEARGGERPFTLIISDPEGNSAIISPKAIKGPIIAEKAEA